MENLSARALITEPIERPIESTLFEPPLDETSDAVAIVDREGRVTAASSLAERNFHFSCGKLLLECLAAERKDEILEGFERALQGRCTELKDEADPVGESTRCEISIVPLQRDDVVEKVVIVMRGAFTQTEALRSSRLFIERVADTLPAVLFVYDFATGRYVYANGSVAKVLGYSPTKIRRFSREEVVALVHPDDHALIEERFRRLREADEGQVFESQYRLRHADGRWRWIQSRDTVFKLAATGEPLQVLGVAADINESVEMMQALENSEHRFRELIERAKGMPWEYDCATGLYSYVGSQAERLLGFPVERWSQEGFFFSRVHTDDLELAKSLRSPAAPGDPGKEAEYRLLHADGRFVWVHDVVHFRNESDPPDLLRGFSLDVTERKRATAERERQQRLLHAFSRRVLDAREEERSRLAREIHDELGQSLTGLKMDVTRLNAATEKLGSAGEHEAIAERLGSMSESIDRLIDTVRNVATQLRPAVLDHLGLGAAIEWQASEFWRRFGIRCDVRNELGMEIENAEMATDLFRTFQEILTNVARHAQASRVHVKLRRDGREIAMDVQDDGRGITKSEINNSLGILGMRERVARHHGTFDISGNPRRRGTTVRVRVPSQGAGRQPRREELLAFLDNEELRE